MFPEKPADNGSTAKNNHTINIYRFWAYGSKTNVPNETSYFLKMVQYINMNNPALASDDDANKDKNKSEAAKNKTKAKIMINYLFHSE